MGALREFFVWPLTRVLLLLILAHAALLLAQFLVRHHSLHRETARKLLHALVGLIFCLCPFLFRQPWPVLVAVAALAILLAARRYIDYFRRHVADVIDGVERRSIGDFCYAASIGLLFFISGGKAMPFCVPLLILALADAAAAIAGVRWGRTRYRTLNGHKSLEGSLTFCAVTFVIVFPALILASPVHPAAALLIALEMAAILGGVEAISFAGLDNLLVPLAAWWLIETLPAASAYHLQILAGVLIASIALAALRPWRLPRMLWTFLAANDNPVVWRRHRRWRADYAHSGSSSPPLAGTAAGGLPLAEPQKRGGTIAGSVDAVLQRRCSQP